MSHSPNPNDQNDQNPDPSSFQFFFKEQALKHVILKMHHHHHHNQTKTIITVIVITTVISLCHQPHLHLRLPTTQPHLQQLISPL